ncbi:segregation/condensation protein A [Patescibacteria group bacterium]|nr:segregation/condensation protein A [Patescibacteria group bacterium]
MTYTIKLEQFEGPLDLLLQLIEDQKLDITQVSLANVTDQYIQHLHEAVDKHQISAGELADFLLVASKLLLIKSKALLPYLEWGEEEEAVDLERQLKLYKEYLEASKVIQKMISKKQFSYSREKLLTVKEVGFNPPKTLTAKKMIKVFCNILDNLKSIAQLPKDVIRKTINIQEKIAQIRNRILEKANMNFGELLKSAKDKTDVIVSFLALLELIKQKTINVEQDNLFEDMRIERIE